MKGIILAGGEGTRLRPLTLVTSKQLLPVYDRPMIFYPLATLMNAGIKEILIIIAPERAGDFLRVLGSGKEFGVRFTYEIQEKPEGIAQAFMIGEDFIDHEPVTLILGDNIFLDKKGQLSEGIQSFVTGGRIFAKQVPDPERYGVIEFDEQMRAQSIVEKPKQAKSNFIVTGLYIYDQNVVENVKSLRPSARQEYEITDLNSIYLKQGKLDVKIFQGEYFDAGTFDALLQANQAVARKASGGFNLPNREKLKF